MIQSAMMFALGFFVSGLLWLALSVALVRRARRLTERRIMASVSTRRAEFETERDELRARHAVQMYRLEREVSRVLDMATAHRLEADVNEHDLFSLKAELSAREIEVSELQSRLAAEQTLNQELERKHAEAGATLRSVQHALQMEIGRRTAAGAGIDEAGGTPEERRQALGVLRAENEALRAVLHERTGPAEAAGPAADAAAFPPAAVGGSVVPMPTRLRPAPAESQEPATMPASNGAGELQPIVGEAHADMDNTVWRAPAVATPRLPLAAGPGEASVAELVAHRMTPEVDGAAQPDGDPHETRFFEALAEIRAMRRATSQAGE